jgi:feruloyl esterase
MKLRLVFAIMWCVVLLPAATPGPGLTTLIAATSCEGLSSLKLPNTAINTAQSVAAGALTLPGAAGRDARDLPAFCRVAATLTPSSDSDIKVEVWLPASGWNGKLQVVGNGGWGGSIGYPAMIRALQQGYATSATDTGHTGGSGSFALGHREKLIDYAYRSEHEMTLQAKSIVTAFYGSGAKRSYWNGCSTGGRQAIVEAQRFPDDFDGIIAGAAANPKTHLDSWRIWMAKAMLKDQASFIPSSKYPVIHQAVVGACDALDGLKDGLIDDPTRCHFDPKVLECKGGDGPSCLTAPQVEAARVVMSAPKDRTGALIFPGFEPGNELLWGRMLGGPDPYATAVEQFKYMVFNDPNWDWRTFDLERDVAVADKAGQGTLAAVDPNLTTFAQHGGKLLMYHGWSDQDIAPQASINYYKSVLTTTKGPGKASDWVRLFMVPGMGHCSGGEGPNTFDMISALDPWVDQGKAPEQILASHSNAAGSVERTRPLCPYPQVARYTGKGSIDEAANFVCKLP